jgi:hypothetical protein
MNKPAPYRWDKREAVFFCIGMVLLPVFWLWWTSQDRFKPWQRTLARFWTEAWVTFILAWRADLPVMFDDAANVFPGFCLLAAIILWNALVIRLAGWDKLFITFIMSLHIIPAFALTMTHLWHSGGGAIAVLVCVVLPTILHWVLNPLRRAGHFRDCPMPAYLRAAR